MPIMKCICGYSLDAADAGELYAELRAHSDEAHPELQISDDDIRRVTDAQSRMTQWDGAPVTITLPIDVVPLAPERLDDFLAFFDRDAFMDNPMWGGCYCLYPQLELSQAEWTARTPQQNRADKAALIERGETQGYLAYAGGKVVGWCHAAPWSLVRGAWAAAGKPQDDHTGAIVCFVVSAPYRRQGIARRLLDGACAGLRERGLERAEAFAVRDPESDARAHLGPLPLYLAAGFEVVRDAGSGVIVRKSLSQ